MRTVLYEDEWVTLSFDRTTGLVRYTRSDVPYPSLDELQRSYAGLRAAAPGVAHGMKLLLDLRLAPPRNDAAFEAHVNAALEGFVSRSTKMATLVRTAVGKLQTARLAHARGMEHNVFDDERAALDYLGVIGNVGKR
jgi:hypothetical protein